MKLRTAFLFIMLTLAMSACGPRGSGYAPAENAVTASPDDDIDLEPHDYELPEAEEESEGVSSTYATGDSSGGANRGMSTVDVDALPMGGGDGHGEESGHGEAAEHGEEGEESHAEGEEASHSDEGEAVADASEEASDNSAESESASSETSETTGAEADSSEGSAQASSGGGSASEAAKALEEIQNRSAELNQELSDLDEQAEALKRDLLMSQIDAASGLSNIRGTYVVREGDTIEAISGSFFGDSEGGSAILEANRDLLDADGNIFPGLVLIIPDPNGSGMGAATSTNTESNQAEVSEDEKNSEMNSEAAQDNQKSEDDEEDSENEEDSEDASESEANEAVAANFDWQAIGEKTYNANCVACHQGNGQGIPGAFPPLANHIPNLYNAQGGKDYIINVVLYGLMGEIEVDGTTYNGVMTPWGQLSDEQIAATLNHELNSWGNDAMLEDFSPILPDDVAALRGQDLSSSDVLELRSALP